MDNLQEMIRETETDEIDFMLDVERPVTDYTTFDSRIEGADEAYAEYADDGCQDYRDYFEEAMALDNS